MIYVAYGANLNKSNMNMRCPEAISLGSHKLQDYKLVFNNVATIVKSIGNHVEVGLWKITDNCEKALDRYEGFPNLYRKEYLDLGMVYIMNYGGMNLPTKSYFDTIEEGYDDFDLDRTYLVKAVLEANDYQSTIGNIIPVSRKRRGGRQWN